MPYITHAGCNRAGNRPGDRGIGSGLGGGATGEAAGERRGPEKAPAIGADGAEQGMLLRLFKAIFVLAILGGIALVGYAYLADLEPRQTRVSEPVTLDLEQGG